MHLTLASKIGQKLIKAFYYDIFNTFFFLNDLFLFLAIDTVFHPSGIIQNGMKISS